MWRSPIPLLLCLMVKTLAAEADDNLSARASINHTWDSNYDRSPDAFSEQITEASLGAGIRKSIRRQTLSAGIGASRYRHRHRDFLDATLYRGSLRWQGEFGSRISFTLLWDYRDRLADRLDFAGRDIINRDEKKASFNYAVYAGWSLVGGVRDAEQTHSNEDRQSLDFEEYDFNAGVQYRSGRGSRVTLRYTGGERHFSNPASASLSATGARGDLDYDYQRLDFETEWQVTGKTRVTGTIGHFDRDGEINSGKGLKASLQTDWQATEKTILNLTFGYDEPAVGEDSTNPSEIRRLGASASWQWTEKITLNTSAKVELKQFNDRFARVPRDEEIYYWRPVVLNYAITDMISMRLASGFQQRKSPIESLNYTAREFSLGLSGQF